MLRSAFSKASGSSSLPHSSRSLGRAARHALAFGLVVLVTALSAGGCSRQGEGERCDLAANGDDDCDEGLICVSKVGNVDRCCPPDGADIGDSRCSVANAPPGGSTGGTSAGGTSSGGATSAGTSSGGTSGGDTGGSTGGSEPAGGTSSGGATSAAGAGGDSAGSGGQDDAAAGSSGASGSSGAAG
jgi:hypothetical protein